MVIIFIFVGGPPEGVMGFGVIDDKFILRRTSRIDAGHDIDRSTFRQDALIVARQIRLHLFFKQDFIRWIVENFCRPRDAVLL